MSPLTKTFVILVTLLSIVLVALVVPFVANTQDLRAKIQAMQTTVAEAQQKAREAERTKNQTVAAKDQTIAELRDNVGRLQRENGNLEDRVAEAEAEKRQAITRNQQLAGSLSVFETRIQQLADINETKTQQLAKARDKMIDLEKDKIQLTNRVATLESSLDSQTRQVRHFKEQYQQARDKASELEALVQKIPESVRQQLSGEEGQLASVPTPPIEGQVTGVKQPSEGVTLVQINVGENDRVRQNMRFMVYRNQQYLGTLVIDRVDADQAVGRLQMKKGQVQSGDRVYAGTDT